MENKETKLKPKRQRINQTSACKKCVYPTKEVADEYIERKRNDIGTKFMELRSYKCDSCGKWHHTSNMTPIYLKRIKDLENELKTTKNTLESISIILEGFYKKSIKQELKELQVELAIKDQKLLTLEQSIKDLFKQ
jgi:acetone carboxylase gamma subunit